MLFENKLNITKVEKLVSCFVEKLTNWEKLKPSIKIVGFSKEN